MARPSTQFATVHTATGAEQRRKWAIAEQMKTSGSAEAVTYRTDGNNAETLIAASDSMNSFLCAKIIDGGAGKGAAAIGFTTISCRTLSGGVIVEKGLP
jgi:hypothetical protein